MPSLSAGAWCPQVPSLQSPGDTPSITAQPGKGTDGVLGSKEQIRSHPLLAAALPCCEWQLHLSGGTRRRAYPEVTGPGITAGPAPTGQFMDFKAHELLFGALQQAIRATATSDQNLGLGWLF